MVSNYSSIFFLDIDDCLIVTSSLRTPQISTIRTCLELLGIPHADTITDEYVAVFNRMFSQHQGQHLSEKDTLIVEVYLNRLKQIQSPVVEKFGRFKKWSREACLFLAAETQGINLSSNQVKTVIEALWKNIGDTAEFYPDAEIFLKNLLRNSIPFYLISASDGRLILDDKSGLFHYDPEYSREEKYKRLHLFTDLGVRKDHIFIADPIDKPDPWIFKQALEAAMTTYPDVSETIMIGDSVKNDLVPAQKAGIQKLVWIHRNNTHTNTQIPYIHEITSLSEYQT